MDLLADMRTARAHGRLVPFLGSGMSRVVCRSWSDMVDELERRSGGPVRAPAEPDDPVDDLALADRASRALERLEHARGESAAQCVGAAVLSTGAGAPPEQTRALAEQYWPLVLTTNYDDLYVAAVHAARERERRAGRAPRTTGRERARDVEARVPPVTVLGRGSVDCHRVLSALRHPAPRLLWALQGYLGGQALVPDGAGRAVLYRDWVTRPETADGARLAREVVVGHADYRRVALRDETFRRSFAEVFRDRSLLFLGSGLRDRYLLDLFGQIVELYGPSPHPHYAIAVRDELDTGFLHRHYGIWVHEIEDYGRLPETIRSLSGGTPRGVVRRWDLRGRAGEDDDGVTVIADRLVHDGAAETCVVLSGGGSDDVPSLSGEMVGGLVGDGTIAVAPGTPPDRVGRLLTRVPGRRFVWAAPRADGGPLVLVARARLDPASPDGSVLRPVAGEPEAGDEELRGEARGRLWRDVRLIADVMREVVDVAREHGCTRLVSTVWAGGRLRVGPVSYIVFEMIRGWGTHPRRLPLTLHVRDGVAIRDLRSGRLAPARALAAAGGAFGSGRIEYWVEVVVRDEVVVRALRLDEPEGSVLDVLAEYSVDGDGWVLDVAPRPCLGWGRWTTAGLRERHRTLSLERLGVLHGSILRIVRSG